MRSFLIIMFIIITYARTRLREHAYPIARKEQICQSTYFVPIYRMRILRFS